MEEDVKHYWVLQNLLQNGYEADAETSKCTFIILQQNTGPNENIKMANKLRNDINSTACTKRLKEY